MAYTLEKPLSVNGYTPNPAEGKAYAFVVDNLEVGNIVGVGNDRPVRVAIAVATLPADWTTIISVYGEKVILVDSRVAKLAKNPFRRKELLALLQLQNSKIYGSDITATVNDGFSMPAHAVQMLAAGKSFGYKTAQRAVAIQNKTIDKSCKPIIKQLVKNNRLERVMAEVQNPFASPTPDPSQANAQA